ncbi:MAG: L-threonylcarbamoyladenylate synthase [Anaerolineales bacterium]
MSKKTQVLPGSDPQAIACALEILQGGGLVAFPTDTVYGLGARVHDARAIQRIFRVKGRMQTKAIPVLLAGADEISKIALGLPSNAEQLAGRFWPGPLTIVVWRKPGLPEALSAEKTIGLRVPDHRLALGLLTVAGPLAATSANRSGEPSLCTAEDVFTALKGRIELILDGGKTPGGEPSTVVDCTRAVPQILRPGPISEEEILRVLR